MGILKKHLSINSDMLQKSDDCEKILQSDTKQLLCAAANAVVDECSDKLNQIVPLDDEVNKKLSSFLTRHACVIDEIQEIFSGFCANATEGMGLSHSDDFDPDFFDEISELSMKSFFFEVTLDRFFFTPLAVYLKLLQPIYVDRVCMVSIFQEVCRRSSEDALPEAMFYYQCWGYSFTPLGTNVFEIEPTGKPYEFEDVLLPSNVSPAPVFDALIRAFYPKFSRDTNEIFNVRAALTPKLLSEITHFCGEVIYVFEVYCEEISDEILVIEIAASFTLDMMHNYLSCLLGFSQDFIDYAYVVGEQSTPFNTYKPNSQHPSLCTLDATLKSLPLERDSVLHYALFGFFDMNSFTPTETEMFEFRLTLIRKIKARYGRIYPWQKNL